MNEAINLVREILKHIGYYLKPKITLYLSEATLKQLRSGATCSICNSLVGVKVTRGVNDRVETEYWVDNQRVITSERG